MHAACIWHMTHSGLSALSNVTLACMKTQVMNMRTQKWLLLVEQEEGGPATHTIPDDNKVAWMPHSQRCEFTALAGIMLTKHSMWHV